MGRRSTTGGVAAKGDRIELTFVYAEKRYRPTIDKIPNEKNLRAARELLIDIKRRIKNGTFDFRAEFPDYKFIDDIAPPERVPLFKEVAIDFLISVRAELDFSTFESYRKILGVYKHELEPDAPVPKKLKPLGFWIPRIGERPMRDIRYSELTNALGDHPVGRKTRNNIASVARVVFNFALLDKKITESPAEHLKTLRVQKEPPDPYTVGEAEALIAALLETYGEHDANYAEYGFFSGMRPSELIALNWPDVDLEGSGITRVSKARVMGRDKDRTKTAVLRDVENCPRALDVLRRQWKLTGVAGGPVFAHENGKQFISPLIPWRRWQFAHKKLKVRYREPYQMRHSSVTWQLMIGENFLHVAEQHGHSPAVMLKTYAKWLKGTTEADIAAIRRAMGYGETAAAAAKTSV